MLDAFRQTIGAYLCFIFHTLWFEIDETQDRYYYNCLKCGRSGSMKKP